MWSCGAVACGAVALWHVALWRSGAGEGDVHVAQGRGMCMWRCGRGGGGGLFPLVVGRFRFQLMGSRVPLPAPQPLKAPASTCFP